MQTSFTLESIGKNPEATSAEVWRRNDGSEREQLHCRALSLADMRPSPQVSYPILVIFFANGELTSQKPIVGDWSNIALSPTRIRNGNFQDRAYVILVVKIA
jgi:hypothetical protein